MMTRSTGILLALFIPLLAAAQTGPQQVRAKADALFNEERYADALPLYAQLVSLNTSDRVLNYHFGTCLLFGGDDKEKAIGHLKFAVEDPSIPASAWYWLARAYHLNYRFVEAQAAYQRFRGTGDKKALERFPVTAQEQQCRNGQKLLSNLKEITVRAKVEVQASEFFRYYDLSNIGGRIVVLPEELRTTLDKKRGHQGLLHIPDHGGDIYFSSYGKDGKTGLDIYSTALMPDGRFAAAQKLAGHINTAEDEDYPYMHPDGRTFYFSSKGHNSMGGYDVFRAQYDKGMDAFAQPENLDFAVNTPDDDIFYVVDAEHKEACFASGRNSSQGQLHVYRVATARVPLVITVLQGTFANEIDPDDRRASIVVEDAQTREQVANVRTDINGSYVVALPRGGRFRFHVDCGPTGKTHSGLVDVPRTETPTAYRQELSLTKENEQERLVIRNYFDTPLEGDMIALALDEIKRRARLDVTSEDAPLAAEVPPVAAKGDILTRAGFSGDVTEASALEMARDDATALQRSADELEVRSKEAYRIALEATDDADRSARKAQELVDKAADQSDERMRNATMTDAARERQRSREANLRARAAQQTARELEARSATTRQRTQLANKLATDLAAALAAGSEDESVMHLTTLRKNIDQRKGPGSEAGVTEEARRAVTEREQEAARALQRAHEMRSEEGELSDRVARLKNEHSTTRNGGRKEQLDREIAELDEQLTHLRKEVVMAFDKARDKERETTVTRGQASLTNYLIARGDASDIVAAEPAEVEGLEDRIAGTEQLIGGLAIDERFDAQLDLSPATMEARMFDWGSVQAARGTPIDRGSTQTAERERSEDVRTADGRTEQRTVGSANVIVQRNERVGEVSDVNDHAIRKDPAIATNDVAVTNPDPDGTSVPGASTNDRQEQDLVSAANAAPVGEDVKSDATDTRQAGQRQIGTGTADDADPLAMGTEARNEDREQRSVIDSGKNGMDDDPIGSKQPGEDDAPDTAQRSGVDLPANTVPDGSERAGGSLDPVDQPGVGTTTSGSNASSPSVQVNANERFMLENEIAELRQMAGTERDRNKREKIEQDITALEKRVTQLDEGDEQASADPVGQLLSQEAMDLPVDRTRIPLVFEKDVEDEFLIEQLFADHAADKERMEQVADADQRAAGSNGLELMLADSIHAEMRRQVAVLEVDPTQADRILPRVERLRSLREDRLALAEEYLRRRSNDIAEAIRQVDQLPVAESASSKALVDRNDAVLDATMGSSEGRTQAPTRTLPSIDRTRTASGEPDPINDRFVSFAPLRSDVYASEVRHRSVKVSEAVQSKEENLQRMQELSLGIDTLEQQLAGMPRNKASEKLLRDIIRLRDERLIVRTDLGQRTAYLSREEWRTANDSLKGLERKLVSRGLPPSEPLLLLAKDMRTDAGEHFDEAGKLRKRADRSDDIMLRDSLYRAAYALELEALREVDRSITVHNHLISGDHLRGEELSYEEIAAKVLGIEVPSDMEQGPTLEELAILETTRTVDTEAWSEGGTVPDEGFYGKAADGEGTTRAGEEAVEAEVIEPTTPEGPSTTTRNGPLNDVPGTVTTELTPDPAASNARKTLEQDGTAQVADSGSSQGTPASRPSAREVRDITDGSDASVTDQASTATSEGTTAAEQGIVVDDMPAIAGKPAALYERFLTNEDLIAAIAHEDGSDPSRLEQRATSAQREANELEKRSMELSDEALSLEEQAVSARKRERERLERLAVINRARSDSLHLASVAQIDLAMEARLRQRDAELVQEFRNHLVKFYYLTGEEMALVLENQDRSRYFQAKTRAMEQYDMADEAERAALGSRELARVLRSEAVNDPGSDTGLLNSRSEGLLHRADSLENVASRLRGAANLNDAQATVMMQALPEEDSNVMMALEMRARRTEPLLAEARDQAGPQPVPVEEVSNAGEPVAATNERAGSNALAEVPAPTIGELEVDRFELRPVGERRNTPIPVDAPMPEGIVYKVQIGAFRTAVREDVFSDMTPVTGERLDNGLVRYTAGLFTGSDQAEEAKEKVRERGYRDAFVVAYRDGKRITLAEAARAARPMELANGPVPREQVAGSGVPERVEPSSDATQVTRKEPSAPTAAPRDRIAVTLEKPVARPAVEPLEDVETILAAYPGSADAIISTFTPEPEAASYYNVPGAAPARQVELIKGLFFTVQVGVYSKPVPLDRIFNITPLNSERTETQKIRYTTGVFLDMDLAGVRRNEAVSLGVTDAFITAYLNGRRIPMREARALLEKFGPGILAQP